LVQGAEQQLQQLQQLQWQQQQGRQQQAPACLHSFHEQMGAVLDNCRPWLSEDGADAIAYCCQPELTWMVPQQGAGVGGDGLVRAGRHFKKGEVVEESPAVLLRFGDLKGCYLEPYCCVAGREDLLLPLGWGLLFGQHRQGNLAVECLWQRPPPPLGLNTDVDAAGPDTQIIGDCRPWLIFRAMQPIDVGQPLRIDSTCAALPPLPPIFEAARGAFKETSLQMANPLAEEEELVLDKAPLAISRYSASGKSTFVAASPIHGLGVFAKQSMVCGDLAELVPVLPVEYKHVCCNMLRDYIFGSDFVAPAGQHSSSVVLLPLGYGGMFNHRSGRPTVYAKRYLDQPFLQCWCIQAPVQAGEELMIDYGAGYWEAPWRSAAAASTQGKGEQLYDGRDSRTDTHQLYC